MRRPSCRGLAADVGEAESVPFFGAGRVPFEVIQLLPPEIVGLVQRGNTGHAGEPIAVWPIRGSIRETPQRMELTERRDRLSPAGEPAVNHRIAMIEYGNRELAGLRIDLRPIQRITVAIEIEATHKV